MTRSTRWMPIAVTSAVAALLTCAAVLTANQAGCNVPGSYVLAPGGVQLVGGCLNKDDLPVAPPPDHRFPPPAPARSLGD
ncbi:MAG: hypothetical protein ACRDSP_11320 [Pseudonocardiaceae bacterium]